MYQGQQYGAYEQSYGSGYPSKSPFVQGQRKQFNLPSMCISLFVPIILFAFLSTICSFSVHYDGGLKYHLCCWGCAGIVLAFGYLAFNGVRRKANGEGNPSWSIFLFVASGIAYLVAWIYGNDNFNHHMKPYYDILNLNVYPQVDPQETRGQQLMDMGRITFVPSARLDISKSMGFRDETTYCVAPIVSGNGSMNRWDLWAVGTNCCSGFTTDFACGEFNNPMAHSGLRLMKDEQRPYFRLAVQQAAAAYNIAPVVFPIFMYFMQDPTAEINEYMNKGYKTWLTGLFCFGVFQLFLVVVATVVISKSG